MDNTEFQQILGQQLQRVEDVLGGKAAEYATDGDRLHNFRVVAELQNISMHQAVVNLMAKHTVSVYDLARSDKPVPRGMWDEKITDHINYLILLKAVLVEEANAETQGYGQSEEKEDPNDGHAVHNPNL